MAVNSWTGNSCDSLNKSLSLRAREDSEKGGKSDWRCWQTYDMNQQASHKWKTPQYVRPDQVTSPPGPLMSPPSLSPSLMSSPWLMSQNTSLPSYPLPLSPPLLQSPPHPLDFPLLYHLLMLQNYCHQNYQEFYKERETTAHHAQNIINHDLNEPLDLSSKSESDSNSVSGFFTDDNKISYDESFKHSEEVEVVHKDDIIDRTIAQLGQRKEETVKDFVSRKIKEHRKSECNNIEVKRFLSESNPKEKYIEKKMTKIKKKYCEINNKIRKLDERKLKLKTPSNPPKDSYQPTITNDHLKIVNNDLKDTTIAQNITLVTKTEPPSPNPTEKEAVKRKLSFDETVSSKSDDSKENSDDNVVKSDHEANKGQDDHAQSDSRRIYLDPEDLQDSARVLLLQDAVLHPGRLSVILEPDIYGVKVDKERGNRPHILSREELLTRAVRDVRPSLVSELSMGARVCVFWSSKMSFLHPGLVTGFPPEDPEYIIVSTDDGDTRDVHISQVRFLPHTFSTIDK